MVGLTILRVIIVAATTFSLLIIPENSTAFFTGIFIFSGSLINDYANLLYTAYNQEKLRIQKVISIIALVISAIYFLLSIAGFMNIVKLVFDKNAATGALVPGDIPGSIVLLPDFSLSIYYVVWPLAIFVAFAIIELVIPLKRTDIRKTVNKEEVKNEC